MQASGFLQALFDFSFTQFVTSRLIKILYGLSIGVAGFFALMVIIGGFRISTAAGLLTLIVVAPLFFLLSVIYARVLMELLIVAFRIAEHTAEIAEQGRENRVQRTLAAGE